MSLEERTSSRFTNFMERSFVNNSSITTGKEQGAMVHGNVTDWMGYGVAVVTGLGQNVDGTNAANDNNQYIGHIDANFAKPLGYKNQVMHIGLNSSYWDADEANTGAFESAQTTLGKGSKFFKLSANGADQLVKQTWGLEVPTPTITSKYKVNTLLQSLTQEHKHKTCQLGTQTPVG